MSMDFLSVFSGAGGLDAGLEDAGWRCRYATDFDKLAVSTLEMNRGVRLPSGRKALQETFIEHADIRNLSARDIASKAGFRKGSVPLMAGGPPCQSWSSAGHQQGLNDPRGQLFRDFVRLATDLDVRWLLFENVRGLLTARGLDDQPGSALNLIRQELFRAGFQTTVSLLNAADFGVPQRRVRLFIIGYRKGDQPPFPTPTHAKKVDLLTANKLLWLSLGDGLRGYKKTSRNRDYPTKERACETARKYQTRKRRQKSRQSGKNTSGWSLGLQAGSVRR